jgi:hypothetical protein
MSCSEFQRQIDIGFKQSGFEISGELLEHIQSCESCSDYLRELETLQEALNQPRSKILPGELDDLTFDKIISPSPELEKVRHSIKIGWLSKWLLAPAVVIAAVILIIMFVKPGGNNVNEYSGMYIDPYSSFEMDNSIFSSDSLSIKVLSSMAGNDATLDRVADELLYESNIDDMLGNLTPDELKALYDKLDNHKG